MQTYSFEILPSHAGKRIDAFLVEQLSGISREKIKKAIQDKLCTIDDLIIQSPSSKLKIGQSVKITLQNNIESIVPEHGELDVVFTDEQVLVCNKPAGITVHPCPSCPSGTYIQRLAAEFPQLLEQDGLRPGIVHRLDKDTSGLLLVALTEQARLKLSADFANRTVEKVYLALVHGVPKENGEIHAPIGRHPQTKVKMAIVEEKHGGRPAHSAWQTLYTDPNKRFSLVQIMLFTGRTHQIRVHMAHMGFPLWGDGVYGPKITPNCPAKRQMLHAWKLSFTHPSSQNICNFSSSPPQDMLDCALKLTQDTQKIVLTGLPGCGKSTLLQEFAKLNIPTWSADEAVKKLYNVGAAGHTFLLARFGQRFVEHPKAEVNRKALREAMQDLQLRKEINANIHALVYEELELFWLKCQESAATMSVAEVPLYLENGRHLNDNTYIIGIECSQENRYIRLKQSRQWTDEQCQSMDAWQWPEAKKMAACQTVVCNNKQVQTFTDTALNIVNKLKAELKQKESSLSEHLQRLWK